MEGTGIFNNGFKFDIKNLIFDTGFKQLRSSGNFRALF